MRGTPKLPTSCNAPWPQTLVTVINGSFPSTGMNTMPGALTQLALAEPGSILLSSLSLNVKYREGQATFWVLQYLSRKI